MGDVGMGAREDSSNSCGIFRCNIAPKAQCNSARFSQTFCILGGKGTAVHTEEEAAIFKKSVGWVYECLADSNDTASGKGPRPSEQRSGMLETIPSAWGRKPSASGSGFGRPLQAIATANRAGGGHV